MSLSAHILDYFAARARLLIFGLALLALYTAVGRFLVPHLAQTRWLPELARQKNLVLHTQRVAIDPFGFTLMMHGLTVADKAGQRLLSADEMTVDLKPLSSLRQGRPALSIHLVAPELRLHRGRQGRFDLLEHMAGPSKNATPGSPVVLNSMTLEKGRVEFRDDLRGRSVSTVYDPIDARFENLGAEPGSVSTFRLAAKGREGERLAAEGSLIFVPFGVQGSLDASRLNLPFWVETLAPHGEWRVKSGRMDGRVTLRRDADAPTGMTWAADRLAL